jgi:hypothetical protein
VRLCLTDATKRLRLSIEASLLLGFEGDGKAKPFGIVCG